MTALLKLTFFFVGLGFTGLDEPPRSDAGQDLVVQLPTDWVVLDGRDSTDDHDIIHYDWALVKGDPSVKMKVNLSLSLNSHSLSLNITLCEHPDRT